MQDAQKGHASHPPQPRRLLHPPSVVCQDSLFAQGRAVSQARPQRENNDGPSKLVDEHSPQDGPDESPTARVQEVF